MAKPTKRLNKRPQKHDRGEGTSTGVGKYRSGLGQAKGRRSITDNKCVRIVALMILPVLFGVFGLIMYPPTFDLSTDNITNGTKSDRSIGNGPILSKSTDKKHRNLKRDENNKHTTPLKKSEDNRKASKSSKDNGKHFDPEVLDSIAIREITVDGNSVTPVELTKDKPESLVKIYKFEGFLTNRECAGLMGVHHRHLKDNNAQQPILCFDGIDTLKRHLKDAGMKNIGVSMKDFTQGTMCLNSSFSAELGSHLAWSHSTSFYPTESKFSTVFEDRIFEATGLKTSNGGKFQVTSYPQGIGYKTHTDCVLGNPDKRDRFATILVYLQDVEEGGETKFPELGISVKPRKGRAIVWNNMNSNGECEPTSLHEAAQVRKGHKFIIQRWYYYKSWPTLGKRAREPSLPARAPGQPLVSCDEYEHGSCRWYDEWNNDHLLEYRAVKSSLT